MNKSFFVVWNSGGENPKVPTISSSVRVASNALFLLRGYRAVKKADYTLPQLFLYEYK